MKRGMWGGGGVVGWWGGGVGWGVVMNMVVAIRLEVTWQ